MSLTTLSLQLNTTLNSTDDFIDDFIDEDEKRRIIQELNNAKTERLLPVLIYLLFLMSIGLVGNAIVLYIYKFRFKRSSSRAFILCLAILDFITCVFGIPYHLYDIYHPLTYYNAVGCKILSFSVSLTLLSSTFILGLISVDRYQKICRPFGKQLSDFGTKKACGAAVVTAIVIAVPHLIMYGNATIELEVRNLTGVECFINDEYSGTTESLIYFGALFVIFSVITVILLVLYIMIGCRIWSPGSTMAADEKSKGLFRRGSFRFCGTDPNTTDEILSETDDSKSNVKIKSISFQKDDQNGNQCMMEFEETSCDSPIVKNSQFHSSANRGKISRDNSRESQSSSRGKISRDNSRESRGSGRGKFSRDNSREGSDKRKNRRSFFGKRRKHTMSISDDETSGLNGESRGKKALSKSISIMSSASLSRRQKRTLRITGMLFMVTLVFVISFLPHLVILVLEAVTPEMFEDMSDRGELIYNFLLRSYFINTMANPIVYTFLDPKFRFEAMNLLRCIIKCQCKKSPRV